MTDVDDVEEEGEDSYGYEFELLNSEDGKIITLVCSSERLMTPDEYAQALAAFAERIESILTMAELSNSTLN